MAGKTCGGMVTRRIPAADFGVPTTGRPRTHATARATLSWPRSRSMSFRRSSSASPIRSAHQEQSSASARRFSGRAATSCSSSGRVAGLISLALGADDADLIRQGLATMTSSATAVFKMALSNEYAREFTVGVEASSPAHQRRTPGAVIALSSTDPNSGNRYRSRRCWYPSRVRASMADRRATTSHRQRTCGRGAPPRAVPAGSSSTRGPSRARPSAMPRRPSWSQTSEERCDARGLD